MDLIKFDVKNPQGLNDILRDLLGNEVTGDWDKDIPKKLHIGSIKKEEVSKVLRGKVGTAWGKLMEDYAMKYLKDALEKNGWNIVTQRKSKGLECDLLGWKDKGNTTPDLHVEVHFPQPKRTPYRLDLDEKATKDANKLIKIGAKNKYLVIGITQNKVLSIIMSKNPLVNIKFQEHRFGKFATEKRKSPNN